MKDFGISCIDGKVPGNFELDLFASGLIDDPFFGTNPLKMQELENRHLWYVRNFDAIPEENLSLCLDGVDTFADVYINGNYLGNCENMLIEHKFIISKDILRDNNELLIHIKPTCIEARKYDFDAEVVSHQPYNAASLNIRKAAHSFGWDIFPRFVSGGLWRDVSIVKEKPDRIKDIFIYTAQIDDNKAQLCGCFDVELSGDFTTDYSLKIIGECGESSFEWNQKKLWHDQGVIRITLDNQSISLVAKRYG